MESVTTYKRHAIVPSCSAGPPYKAHCEITPPGAGVPRHTFLTAEFTSETAAFEAALLQTRGIIQGVTAAASRLQDQGAITYQRGRITVLDRSKLERCSCECYQVVAKECARLMSRTQ